MRRVHFDDWRLLADGVMRGDPAVPQRARDLGAGADADSADLGAALGLLQISEDRGEQAEGLAAAANACGRCHRLRAVTAPGRQAFTHPAPAEDLLAGAVWGATEVDLAQRIAECQACHAK